jgi:hypothetical protein
MLFLLIRIRIIANVGLIPVHITGSQVKPLEFSCSLSSPMAPKGSSKGKGKARAKMTTSVINRRLSLDPARIKRFFSQHIRGPIRIYNVCGIQDERAWDLFYDIIFLDSVRTCHLSQFQLMWPHRRSMSSPFR